MPRPKGLRHTAEARRKMSEKNRAAWKRGRRSRWTGRTRLTAEEKRKRKAARDAARNRRRQEARDRFPEKLDAVARDALNAGASILTEQALRRPTFVVVTPNGRRIETLDPKIV